MLFRDTSRTASKQARRPRREPSLSARMIGRRYLINQELFRDALARERKRADRFEESFVVLLISVDRQRLDTAALLKLADAMSQAKPGADVIGWFEDGSVLGLIRSLAERDPRDAATRLANAVRRELDRALTPNQAGGCSIRCETYSSTSDAMAPVIFDSGNQRSKSRQVARAVAKRALDIVGSTAGLIAFGVVFVGVAIAVKLTSKGPVFFRQERVGVAGRPFTMFKFRTMQVNADPRIHQQYVEGFIQSSPLATSGKDAVFKLVDDPRVTPVGEFLRKSSLDELPQFWNVLRGDMSLVGPRPPIAYEVARYKRWHRRRVLEAKPGMTGLWQVTGRSRTTFDDMVRLDLRYAGKVSVWTDLKILLATPRAVLQGKGAR